MLPQHSIPLPASTITRMSFLFRAIALVCSIGRQRCQRNRLGMWLRAGGRERLRCWPRCWRQRCWCRRRAWPRSWCGPWEWAGRGSRHRARLRARNGTGCWAWNRAGHWLRAWQRRRRWHRLRAGCWLWLRHRPWRRHRCGARIRANIVSIVHHRHTGCSFAYTATSLCGIRLLPRKTHSMLPARGSMGDAAIRRLR